MPKNSQDTEHVIHIEGAREHNLKNISLTIPKNKLTVITGVSGSGKSSLAFSTIFAEGQRRYLESFGAFARQFMGQIERPDIDKISGLSPVISIEQKTIGKNPRSTVGTITEVYDFMRLLYARAGEAFSYETGKPMIQFSTSQIVEQIFAKLDQDKIVILAPKVRGRKGHYRELFEQLSKQGFIRVRVNGELQEIKPKMMLDRFKTHDIEVVIARYTVNKDNKSRIVESLESAFQIGKGLVGITYYDNPKAEVMWFSQNLMCVDSGISYEEPSPNTFSFNSAYGYCPSCKGLGVKYEIDIEAIIPDKNLSIKEGAFAPYNTAYESVTKDHMYQIAAANKININTPIKKLSQEQIDIMLYGNDKTIKTSRVYEKYGEYEYNLTNEGLANRLLRFFEESTSDYVRNWAEQYIKQGQCPECEGSRLKKEALWFKIADKSIFELTILDLQDLQDWFLNLEPKLNKRQKIIAKEILKEINDRLRFLLDVGLHYLSLNRQAGTLSGGESQRIRLATQIGSKLTGITYILDEPSIGLHQEDNQRLINSLKQLRDIGNTIIVVEHDKDIMLKSDYIIDIGPKAGYLGGEILFAGKPAELKNQNTITANHLSNKDKIEVSERRAGNGNSLTIKGASGNNLKNMNITFPLGMLIGITGMSGSGKSTIILDTLYPILMQHCYHSKIFPLKYKTVSGLEFVDKVVEIDQSPIGRTPRSNPATYTNLFSDIRSLYSNLPESKIRGYKPGRFSFNVKMGRCETCKGDGMQKIEMNFLPDVYVKCEECKGKRYNKETLEVRYKGMSISDVLDMTVDDACIFFQAMPSLFKKLKTLQDVGLGYLRIGQSSTTLSGGEAQRVKLSTELSKKDTGKTIYILDEPTTGLHFHDIKMLVSVLQNLVNKGNTVIVIEHNLDVIKCADHLIDIGPGGGKYGGEIVAEGTPEIVAKSKKSLTGKFLKIELE